MLRLLRKSVAKFVATDFLFRDKSGHLPFPSHAACGEGAALPQAQVDVAARQAVDPDLPTPPSECEKYLYLRRGQGTFYVLAIISSICLLWGALLFALRHPVFWVFLPFVALLLFYLGVSYTLGIGSRSFRLSVHQRIQSTLMPECEPSVDVFLPNCGEDLAVLENTFCHVSQLDWPNIRVWVLDDKGREEVETLSRRYGFSYLSRPNRGELKKAGNLRYAFARTRGEFILIFDADFAPRPDFLRELMPYFFADERIAIVQSPQFFEIMPHQTDVQKGAAYEQELFYRMIQVSRNHWGAAICVGTNAVYRRIALEPFGGTAPIAHSEDLHTGFAVLEADWKIRYVPLNLAKGLCPDKLPSFFIQQYRWCTGSTGLMFTARFWKASLSPVVKLNYLSGMLYYIATAAGLIATPLPGILMVWVFPDRVFWFNWLCVLPSLLFGLIYNPLWTRAPFGLYAFKTRIVAYHAHFFALLDKCRNTTAPWVPTNAREPRQKIPHYDDFKTLLLAWTMLCFTAAVAGAFFRMSHLLDFDFWPILFLQTFHTWLHLQVLVDEA